MNLSQRHHAPKNSRLTWNKKIVMHHSCSWQWLKWWGLMIWLLLYTFFSRVVVMSHKNYYRISQPIRSTFFREKCNLNSTCILGVEGKYYFQTYKYPYIYYTTSFPWDSENNREDDFSGSDDDFLGFYDE